MTETKAEARRHLEETLWELTGFRGAASVIDQLMERIDAYAALVGPPRLAASLEVPPPPPPPAAPVAAPVEAIPAPPESAVTSRLWEVTRDPDQPGQLLVTHDPDGAATPVHGSPAPATRRVRCLGCNELRGIDEFHKDNSLKSGRKSRCKRCVSGQRSRRRERKQREQFPATATTVSVSIPLG